MSLSFCNAKISQYLIRDFCLSFLTSFDFFLLLAIQLTILIFHIAPKHHLADTLTMSSYLLLNKIPILIINLITKISNKDTYEHKNTIITWFDFFYCRLFSHANRKIKNMWVYWGKTVGSLKGSGHQSSSDRTVKQRTISGRKKGIGHSVNSEVQMDNNKIYDIEL